MRVSLPPPSCAWLETQVTVAPAPLKGAARCLVPAPERRPKNCSLLCRSNCACTNGTEPECSSGQSCFWFSQGCTVGCEKCDGRGQRYPSWDHCPGTPSPAKDPFYLDKKYWTANQNATPGGFDDIWRFHPWRAPGQAPVWDACGMAGGTTEEVFNAGAYNTTAFAKQGDLGSEVLKPATAARAERFSFDATPAIAMLLRLQLLLSSRFQVLKPRPSGTVWKRGGRAKARWQMTARHGGGYQFRLCPAGQKLTEACFKQTPLAFANTTRHTVPCPDALVPLALRHLRGSGDNSRHRHRCTPEAGALRRL